MKLANHINPAASSCSGCGLCKNKCPEKCIELRKDTEGAFVAVVDVGKCSECGLCVKSCPYVSVDLHRGNNAYAFRSTCKQAIDNSSSGGAFYSIAVQFINERAAVYGVIDSCIDGPGFSRVVTLEGLSDFQGSKYCYVELDEEILSLVSNDLAEGRKVLFSGLPCQIYSIRNTFKKYSDLLVTIDLVCQGAPSPKVLDAYRKEVSQKYHAILAEHIFRSKKEEGDRYVARLTFSNGMQVVQEGDLNLYNCAFSHKLYLRESCYSCPFCCSDRAGDITIGDFWGLDSFKGQRPEHVSLVIPNTEIGERYVSGLSLTDSELEVHELGEAIRDNTPLRVPCTRPRARSFSFRLLERFGFSMATIICYPKVLAKKILQK